MEDFLLIDIPDFSVEYRAGEKYGYSTASRKRNLKNVLEKASRGFCMYCYKRIVVDRSSAGQLEHAVEKDFSKKLIDCVPNIGVACIKCNSGYKKKGQKDRLIPHDEISAFEEGNCEENCVTPCSKFERIKSVYLMNKSAKIILQPNGVLGEDTKMQLKLQYNVLQCKFEASSRLQYSARELEFIEEHIKRFNLNGEREKTRQLVKFLKDTIDNDGYYTKMEYNNYILELFADKLQGKTRNDIVKICSLLYIKAVTKFQDL